MKFQQEESILLKNQKQGQYEDNFRREFTK